MVKKLKSKRTAVQVFSKNLRNQETYDIKKILCDHRMITQKLSMIKQGVETINAGFI